jgi:hypothetical protein
VDPAEHRQQLAERQQRCERLADRAKGRDDDEPDVVCADHINNPTNSMWLVDVKP